MIAFVRFFFAALICSMLLLPRMGLAQASLSPTDLITAVSHKEMAAAVEGPRLRYLERRQTSDSHTATYEVLETDAGSVEWRVAVDGKPLDSGQKRSEEQWLDKLLAHPEIQEQRHQEEVRETERRRKLLEVLPQAFLYEQEGSEQQGRIVRLHFRPNPDFHPPSREAQVFRGMEGTLWVDTVALRFIRAEGTLVKDVSFGWGILGHLDRGGKFSLEQTEVDANTWRITALNLNFDGAMLLFKSIRFRVRNHSSNYRRVADHLSLQQGIQLLREGAAPAADGL